MQDLVVRAEKEASEDGACQLRGRLTKHVIHAAPTCEQEAPSGRQPSATKMPLDSHLESSGNTTRSKFLFKTKGARIVMPVASHSKA